MSKQLLIIEHQIFIIRDEKVMLDYDLAKLYDVPTKALIQAVKRNPQRFPTDFVFLLTPSEKNELVTNCDRLSPLKHSSRPPYAFTEQGVSMLSSVLKSEKAALVNVAIMRAFVKLRNLLATHKDLAKKLAELETKYDSQFREVFLAMRELMKRPSEPTQILRIKGFSKE
jgi:hypothetical protein